MLDDLGISDALEALIGGVVDASGTPVSLCVPARLPALGPDVEIVLYRVAQEALTNALRHADAGSIRVELEPDRNGGVRLEIVDDGRGFDPAVGEGPGIRGMRERALSIGAGLSIESLRGVGVTVRLVTVSTGAGAT
jgi:two-component system sensor histidine kinase UhpB